LRHAMDNCHADRCHECSTPFGISDFGTAHARKGGYRSDRAQRLSASLTSARGVGARLFPPSPRAQPLSASLTSALPIEGAVDPGECVCSTPFGISDFGTIRPQVGLNPQLLCSTPFGISDFGTTESSRSRNPGGCAQRLSASLTSARQVGGE